MDLEDYILLSRIPKQDFAKKLQWSRTWLRLVCQGEYLPNNWDMARIVEECQGKVTKEEMIRFYEKKKQERLEKAVLDILTSDNAS